MRATYIRIIMAMLIEMKCLQLTQLPIVNKFLCLCLELGLGFLRFLTVHNFIGDICPFPHLYENIVSPFTMFCQALHSMSLSLTDFRKYTNNSILSPTFFFVIVIRFDYLMQQNNTKTIIYCSCWFLIVSSSALS